MGRNQGHAAGSSAKLDVVDLALSPDAVRNGIADCSRNHVHGVADVLALS